MLDTAERAEVRKRLERAIEILESAVTALDAGDDFTALLATSGCSNYLRGVLRFFAREYED